MNGGTLYEKYGCHVEPGKPIFKEGETGDRMFIIQEGKVRISKEIGGKEHILAILEKGDFLGEMALVTRVKRTATATAVGNVSLLGFDRNGFLNMIEKNAKIALNVIDKLCRRLQHANLQIHHLVRKNVASLIALNLYYAFTEKESGDPVLAYDRVLDDLVFGLDLSRETVGQELQDLARKGIVTIEANSVLLTDRDRLFAAAEIAAV